MNNDLHLKREFIRWFFEQPYPHDNKNRAMSFHAETKEQRDYWMQQAFKAGAQAMANETRCVLGDWAAACEGLDPEMVTPAEVFDRAEENLAHYFDRVLHEH
jgi:hypothetical protein